MIHALTVVTGLLLARYLGPRRRGDLTALVETVATSGVGGRRRSS